MHWGQFLFWTWLTSSLATVIGLFIICKKSAKVLNSVSQSVTSHPFPPRHEVASKPVRPVPVAVPIPHEIPVYADSVVLKAQSQMRSAS